MNHVPCTFAVVVALARVCGVPLQIIAWQYHISLGEICIAFADMIRHTAMHIHCFSVVGVAAKKIRYIPYPHLPPATPRYQEQTCR